MPTARTKTFRSGNSEAIRLPKEVAFGPGIDLVIVRTGDVVTLYPAKSTIAEMVAKLQELPPPASIEVRDTDLIAEREKL